MFRELQSIEQKIYLKRRSVKINIKRLFITNIFLPHKVIEYAAATNAKNIMDKLSAIVQL